MTGGPVCVVRVDAAALLDDARLADYRILRDPELVRRSGIFLAEGRHVVRTLLEAAPHLARSLLVEEGALGWLEREAGPVPADVPVYVVGRGALERLSGWRFHQGCLAAAARPADRTVGELLGAGVAPRLWVGLDAVTNPDNVGAIVRSAAAFGAGGLALSPGCASPLYRKALRTSMGAALRLPFSHGPAWEDALAALVGAGMTLVALAPEAEADLEDVVRTLESNAPRALLLGAEGEGLGPASLAAAHVCARIEMAPGVDSLNVAAAAAVALYRLRPRHRPGADVAGPRGPGA